MSEDMWLYVAALLLVLSFAVPVRADLTAMREQERNIDSGRFGVGLDTSVYAGTVEDQREVLVAPIAMLDYRLGEAVFESALPLAYVHQKITDGDTFNNLVIGNPWLGLAYLPDCTCGLSRLSAGVAFPLANDDSPLDRRALTLARVSRGDWDSYLWNAELFPAVIGASTWFARGALRITWDGDVILGLPAGDRAFDFAMQNAGDLGFALGRFVQLGARISGLYAPTFEHERFQSALSAYLRLSFTSFTMQARYLFNLDHLGGVDAGPATSSGFGLFLGAPI